MKAKVLLFLFFPVLCFAQTYTFSTLVNFPATSKKGPIAPESLTIDSSGNLYGISSAGGTSNLGTVFKVTPKGVLTTLHSFIGTDGSFVGVSGLDPSPINAGLVRDSHGNLFGTTPTGGATDPTCPSSGCGTVFKMIPTSNGTYTLTTLFSGAAAQYPTGVALDSLGDIWGLAAYGGCGSGCGVLGNLFEINTTNTFIDIHDFCQFDGEDGCHPTGSPIVDKSGNIEGVSWLGGFFHDATDLEDGGYGLVFSWSPAQQALTALHTFTNADCVSGGCDTFAPTGINDGSLPLAKVTQSSAGVFYGTTAAGGNGAVFFTPDTGFGTVYQIKNDGSFGNGYSILYEFCQQTSCTDGAYPSGPLIRDSSGNLFGTASGGGANGHGVVFRIDSSGNYKVIYNGGTAGVGNNLVMDKSGNLYGTTLNGGPSHNGSVYKLTKK